MRAALKEMLDEIDMTVAAINDVKSLMLDSEDKPAGGECLHVLVNHLKGQMAKLWEEVTK